MRKWLFGGLAGLLMGCSQVPQILKPDDQFAGYSQVVLLNFDGGAYFKSDSSVVADIRPFEQEISSLDSSLVHYADDMKREITSITQLNFARYNIKILSTEEMKPSGISGEFSQVYFGGSDTAGLPVWPNSLGAAETLDAGNSLHDDNAIVLVPSFKEWFGRFNPSWATYSQLMALVASHELGHIFGLKHDLAVFSIMALPQYHDPDVVQSKRWMFTFKRGTVIDSSTAAFYPFDAVYMHTQDAPAYLSRVLGPANTDSTRTGGNPQ